MKDFILWNIRDLVLVISGALITVPGMFATIFVSIIFDLDPAFAEWCADVLEAIFQSNDSIMENARRLLRKEDH